MSTSSLPSPLEIPTNPTKIYSALLAGCLLVMAIAAIAYWSITRYRMDNAWVIRSHQVNTSLESILAQATELQNALRGYVISGNPVFLESTVPATRMLDERLRELSAGVSDNPEQAQRARQLEQLVLERKNLSATIEVLRERSFDAAQAEIIGGQGLRNHAATQRLVQDMRTCENERLTRRMRASAQAGNVTAAAVGVGSILCFACAAVAFDRVRRDFSRLSRRRQELLTLNEQLDRVIASRTSELTASRDLLDRIINSTPPEVQIFALDRQERFTLANDALLRALGRTREQVLGRRLNHMFSEETAARMHAEDVRIMESLEPVISEQNVTSPEGVTRTLLASKFPLLDENGIVVGLGGVAADITERKRRDAALRVAQERYRVLFEKAPIGIAFVGSTTGLLHEVNVRYVEIVGRPREELLRIDWMQITHPDDVGQDLDQMARLNSGEITEFQMNKRYLRPDGSIVWINMLIAPLGILIDGGPSHVCMVEDITERVRFHQQMELFIDSAPVAIAMFDRDMCYLAASRRWRENYGLRDRPLTGLSHYAVFPDLPERWKDAHRRGMAGEASRADEDRFERSDGSVKWVRWELRPWYEASGAIGGVVLLTEDITRRKAIDAELAAHRSDLEAAVKARTAELADTNRKLSDTLLALERAGTSIAWVDADTGRFVYVNGYGAEALGFTPDELKQQTVADRDNRITPEAYPQLRAEIRAKGSHRFETEMLHRDGRLIPFEISVYFHPGSGTTSDRLVAFGNEITQRKRMESALRERERLLTESQRLAHIGSWVLETDGQMTWTEEVYHLFEQSPTSLTPTLGELASLLHPDDRALLTAALDFQRITKAPVDQIVRRIRMDGTLQYLNIRGEPLESGGPRGRLRGTIQDISALQQSSRELAEQQRLLSLSETKAELLLRSTADGLYGIDAEGRITFINPAGCTVLGVQSQAVVGRLAHELFHHTRVDGTPYPAAECPIYDTLRTGEARRIDDEVFWHSDGHPIPVLYACHPMSADDRIIGAVVSFVDNTVRKAADDAREAALAAAERLARLRQEFLSNVSHELRTPLNGVLGFAAIGLRTCQDSEKARLNFDRIRSAGQHLLAVIDDILDFSQLEQGKMPVESVPVNLSDTLRQSVECAAGLARTKNLNLHFEREAGVADMVLSDPRRLKQILGNLLSNAVKFTDAGRVSVTVSQDGDSLLFAVSDTGIGITREQMERIFRPFEQGDGSLTRRYGGSGLGLTISARLVELMGGDIQVESAPGAGSTFTVRLPYRPVGEVPASTHDEPDKALGDLSGLTVLVVEDNPANQVLIEAMLTSSGAAVVTVDSGAAAIERIAEDGADTYSLVLMDIQMPVMDGFATTAQIRAMEPDLPIVAQTAHALKHDRAECIAAGMQDYIAKPFTRGALIEITRKNARVRS